MSTVEQILEASRSLQPEDRLRLAEALWELVAADDNAGEISLSGEQREEFDRRWERFQANPDTAIGWSEGLTRLAAMRNRR